MNRQNDIINHPRHYCVEGMRECIEEMLLLYGRDAVIGYCQCNVHKYRYRADYKGHREEDMAKANWYLNKLEELRGGAEHE